MDTNIKELPPFLDLETKTVLKKVASSHRALAELKGLTNTIPNPTILVNNFLLLEAKASSAIENIFTDFDEIYKNEIFSERIDSIAAKEVQSCALAIKNGFSTIKQDGLLANRHFLAAQELLEHNSAGFRKLPGTDLKNVDTGETIYTPPQDNAHILKLMSNLERYINEDNFSSADVLIKMAVIHYQFETIHPFYDSNGRTGRIIISLYLILKGLLNLPILNFSHYLEKTKPDYYRLLQSVRLNNTWEEWLVYFLTGVEQTANKTIFIIQKIKELMQRYKQIIRKDFNFYSHALINNLFCNPYTSPEILEQSLQVSRLTATKYLDKLVAAGLLEKQKISRSSFYVNRPLFELLTTF